MLSEDGSQLVCTNAAHNTHGSLQEINGQWYVFYHRPPRGFGFARQAMVAPVKIVCDEKPVAEGGKVTITGFDPYAPDQVWQAKAANGNVYTGAEVTSEGFQVFGMDPYKYYSAGYACYLSNVGSQQDSWDIWDNNMPILMKGNDIVGFKYFGFGGLDKATLGLKPFAGVKAHKQTIFNLFLTPTTDKAFKVSVWLDGPWDNATWKGKKLGEISVPANAKKELTAYTLDVTNALKGLDKKHAIFLKVEGDGAEQACVFHGLGFSADGKKMTYPTPPTVSIQVDGQEVEMPATPVRFTHENGYPGYDQYEANYKLPAGNKLPKVTAKAQVPGGTVKISIEQPATRTGKAIVKFDYKGVVKTYTVNLTE